MKTPVIAALLLLGLLAPTTTALAEPAPAPEESPLPRAVALAREAARLQAARLGLDVHAAPTFEVRHESPSEAAFALLARHDVALDEGQAAQLRALDALPEAQREALTRVIDAFLGFQDSTKAMYAAGVDAPDFAPGLAARDRLLDAALLLEEAFPARATSSAGCAITYWPAFALDLMGCDDTYENYAALSIDVGGADTYRNNAGGSYLGWVSEGTCDSTAWWATGALFDLGGNDLYTGRGVCPGRIGGGSLGQGFLLDVAGDDVYAPANATGGANGGGYFAGSGFLLDAAGADTYKANANGVNGGGHTGGIGLLVDADGNDAYTSLGYGANGGGHTGGAGLLLDGNGNDRYTVLTWAGNGGGASGGVGALVDLGGSDVYEACCDAVNGGGQLGVGLLLDVGGWDSYRESPGDARWDETEVKGTGVQLDVLSLTVFPGLRVNGDGTCRVYNDENRNGRHDSIELFLDVGCNANPVIEREPDGTCYLHNDSNGDGVRDWYDVGERIPCPPEAGSTVPVRVPAAGESLTIPALSTPGTPPTDVTTPPVVLPATCPHPACGNPTTIPGTATPPIPEQCVPPVLCVGPIGSQPLTPPVTLPAPCALAPICLPPTTLAGSQTVAVPGQPPIPLTRPVTVSVTSEGFEGGLTPIPDEPRTIGPLVVQVGPVPVTLCPGGCIVPAGPDAALRGSVTITVVVEGQTYTQTVPVDA